MEDCIENQRMGDVQNVKTELFLNIIFSDCLKLFKCVNDCQNNLPVSSVLPFRTLPSSGSMAAFQNGFLLVSLPPPF